jgi:hypothetical protein
VKATPEAVECLQNKKGECTCIEESLELQTCLAECLPLIASSMRCDELTLALEGVARVCAGGSADPECQVEKEEETCDASAAATLLKQCVAKEEGTVECLRGGSSQCECLMVSETVPVCLGPCWDDIVTALECGDDLPAIDRFTGKPEVASEIVPNAKDEGSKVACEITTASKTLSGCVAKDVRALECLQEGKTQCECLLASGTVRVFRQKITLEDAIGSHACSLEGNMRGINGIPLGCSLLLPVDPVNCVQTLKARCEGASQSVGRTLSPHSIANDQIGCVMCYPYRNRVV